MEAKARLMLENPMVPEAMKTQVRQMLAQTQQLRQQGDSLKQQVAQAAANIAEEEDEEEEDDEQSAMETKMRAMLSNPMVPEEMKAEVRAMLSQTQQLRNQVAELAEDESEDEDEESDEESEEDEESEDESEQAELLQSRMDELAAQRAQLIATKAQLESEILEAQGDLIQDQNQVEEVLAADGSEEQLKVMREAQTILADPSIPDAMKVEVQAMLSQLTSARSQMFNAAASLSETKQLHEEAIADAEDVDQQQESAGREVALLEQLAQLEGERERMLQMRSSLQSSLSASAVENEPVQAATEEGESDEAMLTRLQRERQMLLAARDELQQSAAAGMSIDDWHQKWDGATLNGTSLLSSSLSPGAQRATGSVATGEEATLVERAAGLSLQEKQELAAELKIMEQVQSLSKQQRKQFASSVGANPAAAAATGAPITAQKFAEIEGLCKAVNGSDISDEAKAQVASILASLTGDFPQLQGQEPATNLAASAPIHRSAPAAPSPIMAAPQFTAENSTSAEAPSENVSMLMNQLGSVQGMLSQLQNSSTEGSQLEGLLAQLESMPQPQARATNAPTATAVTPVRMMPVQRMVPRASPFMAYQGMPVISAPVTPRDLHSGSLSQSAYTSGHTPHAGSQTARLPASAPRADQLRREQATIEQLASQIDSSYAGLMSPFRTVTPRGPY